MARVRKPAINPRQNPVPETFNKYPNAASMISAAAFMANRMSECMGLILCRIYGGRLIVI